MEILFANFLIALGYILRSLLYLFQILFIARAVLSWVSPDPYNPIVQFINGSTEPILSRIRSKVPPLGMFDVSIIVAIFALIFLDQFLAASIMDYGMYRKHIVGMTGVLG